jgi:hypothetical protein
MEFMRLDTTSAIGALGRLSGGPSPRALSLSALLLTGP